MLLGLLFNARNVMPIFNNNFHEIMFVLDDFVNLCNMHSRKIASITGLSEAQITALKEIFYNQNVSHTKLTRKLNFSQYKVKMLLESLISKQLIERVRNNEDKRVWALQLTEEGKNIL